MALTMLSLAAIAGKPTTASAQLVAEGRESAARLYALLVGSSALHGPLDLAEQILLCFDRALAKLHGVDVAGAENDDAAGSGNVRKRKPGRGSAAAASSKRMRVSNGGGNGARIERKATMDDKFLWRKYGQKEIKNSKYPRFYYRCSYKDDHGCTATKQVQQSETADDDTASPVYVITYFGEHTCRHGHDAAAMVADGGEEDQLSPAQMVISFASSGGGGDASVSWPCSGDDAQNNSETSHESSPPEAPAGEEEHLRPCTAAADVPDEPIMESTPPAPELLADLKLMDGCLLDGESLFGMDELVYFHELSAALGLLDRDWGAPV
ncbi:transcription factor WRKY45-1-like [Oryza glaberrima]|uniref:WRKY domain-containing protein n=1 Tax=Oryza glaberrima TaxID=4538 RepID=I1PWM6_ORYGL|nr:transcription factor WRKY45-1-like [Oryza glaberrima]